MTNELITRLVDSYHDVANELSDLLATWDGGNGLPPELDKAIGAIRDAMDGLYMETIPIFQRGSAVEPSEKHSCKANRTADPPQDCDWPWCGCDPAADKVIEALEEQGVLQNHRRYQFIRNSENVFRGRHAELFSEMWRQMLKFGTDMAVMDRVVDKTMDEIHSPVKSGAEQHECGACEDDGWLWSINKKVGCDCCAQGAMYRELFPNGVWAEGCGSLGQRA